MQTITINTNTNILVYLTHPTASLRKQLEPTYWRVDAQPPVFTPMPPDETTPQRIHRLTTGFALHLWNNYSRLLLQCGADGWLHFIQDPEADELWAWLHKQEPVIAKEERALWDTQGYEGLVWEVLCELEQRLPVLKVLAERP